MIQLTWKEVMYLHVTDLTMIRLKVMRSSFCRFCIVASLFVVDIQIWKNTCIPWSMCLSFHTKFSPLRKIVLVVVGGYRSKPVVVFLINLWQSCEYFWTIKRCLICHETNVRISSFCDLKLCVKNKFIDRIVNNI